MPSTPQWSGLVFETASDLAAAARKYTTKVGGELDVKELFPADYPPYDGYHLKALLKHKGYKPRLSGDAATKLLKLVAKAKSEFESLPGEPMDLVFDLEDSIDVFLGRALTRVAYDEYPGLRDLVCSRLDSADGPDANLSRVLETLRQRLPGRQLEETPKVLEAFVRVQEAAVAMDEISPKYGLFWERCLQIARRVVNRGRHGTRRVRQLYIAESIFDHLCHGAPLSKGDLEGTNRNYVRWLGMVGDSEAKKLGRALRDAAAELSPSRRVLEDIIRDAYKRLGSVGSYESFRRRVYRHFEEREPFKNWLMTAEPQLLKLGSRSS